MQTTFFYLQRFLKKLATKQYSSITTDSIYHIKHVHTTFYHSSGLTRNWMFNGIILCFIFADTAFLLGGAEIQSLIVGEKKELFQPTLYSQMHDIAVILPVL